MQVSKADLAKANLKFLDRVEIKGTESDAHFFCKQWMSQIISEEELANKPAEVPDQAEAG